MYAVFTPVPFRRTGPGSVEVASDWRTALVLLRDSFGGRFGPLTVAGPETPPGDRIGDQMPAPLDAVRDGIRFERLGDATWRARHFWRAFPGIRAACDRIAREATVVHAGLTDVWQPYSLLGFQAAVRARRTSVFVLDGDAVRRMKDLNRGAALGQRLRADAWCTVYSRAARRSVAAADLSLLKGGLLIERYGAGARNAQRFYNTSYAASDVVDAARLEEKCGAALAGGPLGVLSLGRLVAFKGVEHTIAAVAAARRQGADVRLAVIGDGPARASLEALAAGLGVAAHVEFRGARPYGPALLREAARSHVLAFTSEAEETPRALFDGLAAGTALVAFDLPFTREVVEACGHGALVPAGDDAALAGALVALDRDRPRLAGWMRAAAARGLEHASEVWYARRAQWTVEAHERRARGG